MKSESLPYHIKPSFQCYPHTTVVFFYWHAHTKITNLRTHKNYIKSKLITPRHISIESIRALEIFGNRIWPQARSPPPNRLPRGNIDIFRSIDRSIWSMSLNYVWLFPTAGSHDESHGLIRASTRGPKKQLPPVVAICKPKWLMFWNKSWVTVYCNHYHHGSSSASFWER